MPLSYLDENESFSKLVCLDEPGWNPAIGLAFSAQNVSESILPGRLASFEKNNF